MADENKTTENKTVEGQQGENQTGSQSGEEKKEDFLKTDPDKTGAVKKTTEELEKIIEINKKLQSNFDKEKQERLNIELELKKEREKTLSQKQLEEIRQQEMEQALKSKELELKDKELKFNKSKLLNDKGWDSDFLDIISGNDLETFQENCKALQVKIDKFIEKKVNERISKGNPVPTNTSGADGADIFSVEELKTLPKINGNGWTIKNMEKIDRSMKFHYKK